MAQPSAASPLLEVARVLSQHLQHQQLPHWHTVCLSLRLLNTAAAAATAAASASNAAHQHEWNSHAAASNTTATAWSSPSSTSSSSSQALEQDYRAPWRARVLDGKAVAAAWSSELQQQVADLSRLMNRRPGLAVVLVGNRPDSCIYVSRKQEACKSIGIHCRVLRLPDTVSQADLQACVSEVSADRAIDGVLVQLPLPKHLDEEAVMEALDPQKDVDGFHPLNMGRMLMRGRAPRFVPATPLGVVELLSRSRVSLAGKTAVVLGDSNIVGTPIAALLRDAGVALVTTCHRVSLQDWFEHQARSSPYRAAAPDVCLPRLFGPMPPSSSSSSEATAAAGVQPANNTSSDAAAQGQAQHSSSPQAEPAGFQPSHLPAICRTADILVVAVGSPELIKADWVKPGAVVVDVGINVVPSPRSSTAAMMMRTDDEQPPPPTNSVQDSGGGGGGGSASVSASRSCKPEVQLQLVQTDPDGTLSLSADYSVVGDVAHEEVARVASVVTPVPGGVGPMTIAAVLHNTLQAAKYTAQLLRW